MVTTSGPKTIVRALASLLKQWNLEYPSNVCCRYHAVTSLVVYLLTCELRSKRPRDDWQCSHCKTLHSKEQQECSFCTFDEEEEEGLQDHQGWTLSCAPALQATNTSPGWGPLPKRWDDCRHMMRSVKKFWEPTSWNKKKLNRLSWGISFLVLAKWFWDDEQQNPCRAWWRFSGLDQENGKL
eukprot:s460_g15.t1